MAVSVGPAKYDKAHKDVAVSFKHGNMTNVEELTHAEATELCGRLAAYLVENGALPLATEDED